MLSKEVCQQIWHCHREIETGEELLKEVEEIATTNQKRRSSGESEKSLKDVFGRDSKLQLGVPSGENSHRLFSVSYELAKPVIETHIANKKLELAELNQIAKLEVSATK